MKQLIPKRIVLLQSRYVQTALATLYKTYMLVPVVGCTYTSEYNTEFMYFIISNCARV